MERGDARGVSGTDGSPHAEALPPCELRRVERTAHGRDVICGAADVVLGELGRDDAAVAAVCRACPVPAALTDRWACLHLRPIRFLEDGQWQSFFSCRWFYRLNPRRQARSLQGQCYGCPYWFPRPDVALIPGYWEETRQIWATVAEARGSRPSKPSSPAPSPVSGRGGARQIPSSGHGRGWSGEAGPGEGQPGEGLPVVKLRTGQRPDTGVRPTTGIWRLLHALRGDDRRRRRRPDAAP
jgi:hypothetical protein